MSVSPYDPGPIVACAVYKNDVLVMRKGETPYYPTEPMPRGEVSEFSRRSRQRLAFIVNNAENEWKSMLCLTYPATWENDGKVVKRHLNTFLTWLRYHLPGTGYLWFLEFQKRGAPHVHILLDWKLPGCPDAKAAWRKRVAAQWYGIVKSGDPKHLVAGTSWDNEKRVDGLRHYAVKYAQKMHQKLVPKSYRNVGRFWGRSTNVVVEPVRILALDEDELRVMLTRWPYYENDGFLWRVLYNASQSLLVKT